MESLVQTDLAKEEPPARQILPNALKGAPSTQLVVPLKHDFADKLTKSSTRPLTGIISTTHQARLKRKHPSRGPALSNPLPNIELDTFGESSNVAELQPVDTGFGAWSYVAAAFSMYIVVWGFPYSFPVFQTFLSAGPNARFPDSIAIRLLAPGLQDIEEGIVFPFLPIAGRHRRSLVLSGILIITISIVVASYAQHDWQIVLAQGVAFGLGGIMLNFVHVSIFSEWFDKKKGQAMGIIWSGWRVGALAFPLICQWLLEQHGFEKTLRVLIAPMISLLVPAMVLFRGRYHSTTITLKSATKPVSKLQALGAPSVLYYLCATCMFYLVINVPKMFITTFAADLGIKGSDQALALVLLVLSEMVGTYLCGYLSATMYHEGLTAFNAIATSITHLLGMGYARGKASVLAYAVVVGLTSGGFTNCLFAFYGEAARGDGELFTAIHSLFSFFRGIAILSVGPIGAELLRRAPDVDTSEFAISRYQVRKPRVLRIVERLLTRQSTIVFTGILCKYELREWLLDSSKVRSTKNYCTRQKLAIWFSDLEWFDWQSLQSDVTLPYFVPSLGHQTDRVSRFIEPTEGAFSSA